jgi:hypothetical protein
LLSEVPVLKKFLVLPLFALLLHAGAAFAAPIDPPDIPRCTELVPGAIAIDEVPISLNLRLVLDGVSSGQVGSLVAAARSAYEPLGIRFHVTYDEAQFGSADGLELLAEVKRRYGGQRPFGTHLVYVLTSKDLTDAVIGDSLAGQADCIGGVAYPENAFAVGEADPGHGAKTMAHELGHLMGGHHHWANCGESLLSGDNLCTLMINDVGLASLVFSTLNGWIVRGHGQVVTGASALPDEAASRPLSTAAATQSQAGGGALPALALGLLLIGIIRRRLVSG